MHEAREASETEVKVLGRSLARAFEDDPIFEFLLPATSAHRMDKLAAFFNDAVRTYQRRDKTVLTEPNLAGAALWAPPGQWKAKPADLLRSTPAAVRIFGSRLPLALRALARVEKKHTSEPHWYLGVLGTEPEHQGKGIGAALLRPILDRCDREGIGAYLESSKEQNVPYYRRFGFEVTEEVVLPKGGPSVWLMWRDPHPDIVA